MVYVEKWEAVDSYEGKVLEVDVGEVNAVLYGRLLLLPPLLNGDLPCPSAALPIDDEEEGVNDRLPLPKSASKLCSDGSVR